MKSTIKATTVRPESTGEFVVSAPSLPLREAINRVYRVYGRDLAAFYRDVREESERRAKQTSS